MIKLSKRLATIAELVPDGSALADIGTDHALLPVYLVQQGRIRKAVAGELNLGPYEAALRQVRKAGLESSVSVRRGDGLRVLAPGEADAITIAGMGGGLIVNILDQDEKGVLAHVRTLILQPNVAEDAVRRWLLEHDYVLDKERIVEEDGIAYVILKAVQAPYADRTQEDVYRERTLPSGYRLAREDLIRLGPYLVERMEPEFVRKLREEKEKLEKIRRTIAAQASSPQSAQRLREVEESIGKIANVLRGQEQEA
jgi:tRNA (adenine22-N1)-methyltransferase